MDGASANIYTGEGDQNPGKKTNSGDEEGMGIHILEPYPLPK